MKHVGREDGLSHILLSSSPPIPNSSSLHFSHGPCLRLLTCHALYLEPPIFSHLPSNLPTEFKQETQIISPFRYSALIVRKVVLLFFRTITQNPLDHISSLTLKLREAKKLFQVYTVIGAVDSSPGWSHTHHDPVLLTTLLQVPGFFSHYSHGALDEQRPNHKKDETIHTIIRAYLHLNVTLGLTLYSLLNRNSWVLQVKIVI